MLNQCSFIGNLGRDPEVRHTQDGSKLVNMSLAVSDNWKDKNTGERRERTEWIRIVIFNERLADVAEKYLKKGSKIFIQGAMQTRKWTDQSGVEKYSTEVVLTAFGGQLIMLDGKPQSNGYDQSPGGQAAQAPSDIDSDSIPF